MPTYEATTETKKGLAHMTKHSTIVHDSLKYAKRIDIITYKHDGESIAHIDVFTHTDTEGEYKHEHYTSCTNI